MDVNMEHSEHDSYIKKTNKMIIIQFRKALSDQYNTIETEGYIDINKNSEIAGVELLHLAYDAGRHIFEGFDFDKFNNEVQAKATYDPQADGFYIKFPLDPSVPLIIGRYVPCAVIVDNKGHLLRLEVYISKAVD